MSQELFEQINGLANIELERLNERDDQLTLDAYISEARALDEGESEADLRKFKITFRDYIAYSVRNESFTGWDEYEKFDGSNLRNYSKSRFLDYLNLSTDRWLVEQTMGAQGHFGAVCLNHLLDVAICREPEIEEIKG